MQNVKTVYTMKLHLEKLPFWWGDNVLMWGADWPHSDPPASSRIEA